MEITRRRFIAGTAGVAAAIATGGCASTASSRPLPKFAYVGCYTAKQRNGHGEVVTAFRIDEATGRLSLLGTQDAKGKNGVRLGVDASNRFVVCANYSSGTVAVLPIQADGSLGPVSDLAALNGKPGPHRTEQASSHPHDIVFDRRERFIVVPDKGLDATFVFSLDPASGKLVPATPPSVASRPGAGPRHAGFHPSKPCVYVLNELDSTLTTYGFDAERGALTPLQVITTLPP